MNVKRYILATICVCLFLACFDWLWYGHYLMDFYTQTSQLWRSYNEINHRNAYIISNFVILAGLITHLYRIYCPNKTWKDGLYFGALIGLLIASREFQVYPYLPVPLKMALLWALGGMLMGLSCGFICHIIFKTSPPKKKTSQ